MLRFVVQTKRLCLAANVWGNRFTHVQVTVYASKWRNKLFKWVSSERFELSIAACIVVNVVILATYHEDQTAIWTVFQETTDSLFLLVFALESVIKVVAFGPKNYFSVRARLFDQCRLLN